MGKNLRVLWFFDYMYRDEVCSNVEVLSDLSFRVTDFTNDLLKTAFGRHAGRGPKDLDDFFRERCCPETRVGIEDILKKLGLPHFSAIDIVRNSHGVLTDDHHWVRFNGENLTWQDVRKPVGRV